MTSDLIENHSENYPSFKEKGIPFLCAPGAWKDRVG